MGKYFSDSYTHSPIYSYTLRQKEDFMAEGIVELTTAAWDKEVLQANGLVMVDFWAVWCGPCRMIAPTVEELSKEYAGKVKVGKLNTDENPDIASKYKIMGIPTIMFFKDGQKVDQIVGAVPKPQLKAKIDALLQG
jgi:thioredoxin 1